MAYELVVLGKASDNELPASLCRLHARRMKEKERSSSKKDIIHRISTFFRIMVKEYHEKHNNIVLKSMTTLDASCIIVVYIDSNVAGYLYGLKDVDTIRILQNCVDEKYSFYSPMFRGIYEYISLLYNDSDIRCIDFTRGNEEYKYKLGGKETVLNGYRFKAEMLSIRTEQKNMIAQSRVIEDLTK